MVIEHIIFDKVTFIISGRHQRFVFDRERQSGCAAVRKGLLHTYLKGSAVGTLSDGQDIASKIDDGTFHLTGNQIFLQAVCDIAFGDEAKIQHGIGIL